MKLLRLALLRYGHLSDVVLDFPPEAALCVVHGANEAGKSTALAAIGDALFGFDERRRGPRYDFLHGGPQLRVGVSLAAHDGATKTFVRRKGRANTLRDGDDAPVPEAALQGFLGGAGRETFEHMFGLNAERLRSGGQALAQGGGGVGESLFAAGTGLLGLRATLARLDEEAKALVGDGRGRRRLSEAVESWRLAQRAAEQRAVPPRAWQEAEAAHAAAVAALADVTTKTARLLAEGNRLQRVRRVAPLLVELAQVRAVLHDLADAPHLPADAAARLRQATTDRDRAREDARRETEAAAALSTALAALPRAPAILAAQDRIDLLAEQRAGVVQILDRDLPEVRLDIERLRAELAAAVAELGTNLAPEAARDAVPPAPARRAVQRLLSEQAALQARADAAARAQREAAARREAAAAALQSRPAPPDPALLRATIDDARAEGRLDADLARAESRCAAAEAARAAALAALPLWHQGADALAACRLPLPAQTADAAGRLDAAALALAAAAADLRDLAEEIAALEDDLARLARGETVPTPAAVLDARATRDRAWRLLRRRLDGEAPHLEDEAAFGPAPLPDAFETLRDAADRLADRRADDAQRVADYLTATDRLKLVRVRHADATARHQQADRDRQAAEIDWHALWQPAGITPAAPPAMAEWLRARADVLKLAAEAEEAGRQRDDLARRRDAASARLLPLLPDPEAKTATLADLLTRAELACAAAEREAAAHRTLAETLARETAAQPALDHAVAEAADALALWQTAWAKAVAPLGLPPAAGTEAADAALGAWARIAEAAPLWRAAERRIEQMAATVDAFAAATAAAHAATGAPPSAEPAPAIVAGLARALAEARRAEAEAATLAARIASHTEAAAEAQSRERAAEAELAALRHLAGAGTDAALAEAIERAHRRDLAEADRARLLAGLALQGDGLDEAALRADVESTDPDAAAARLAAIEADAAQLGARREDLSAARTRAEAALEAMRQGNDAAAAAQEASHALAEATEAAERYARLHVARVLLRAGIDRFRRAQQGPLLAAAGRHFATLTGGRYARLGIDEHSPGQLTLSAVRDEGTECPVEALSEGTRDQLYLALRVAAIEAHAAAAEPLPFIADDLLAPFDDTRAAAAIALLAELGRATQVILFTHHAHVAGLAAAQAHAGVCVLRLSEANMENA